MDGRLPYLVLAGVLVFSGALRADHLSEPPPTIPEDLQPVPELDTSGAEPRAQDAIRGARRNVDTLLNDSGADPSALADAYGRLGAYYHTYNILTGAEICYRNAIRLDPSAYRWRHLLAYLVYSSGRYEEALGLFAEARHLDPGNAALDLYEGVALVGLNRTSEGESLLRKALGNKDLEAAAAMRLGQIELDRRAFEKAVPYFELTLQKDPKANRAYVPLAQALRGAGRADEARAALSKRGKTLPHVGDPIVEDLDALDQGSRPHYISGMEAARQGDYAGAATAFGQGLESDPGNYRARNTYARALYLSGQPAEARAQLEKVEAVAPADDPLATFLLGVLDYGAGNLELARDRFETVLKVSPDHSGALYFLGLMDFEAGDYAAAAARLDGAVEKEPGNHYAQVLSLVARHRLGQGATDPTGTLTEIVKNSPTQFLPRYALIRWLAVTPSVSAGDGEDDLLAMAEALVADYSMPPSFEALALAKAAAGDLTGAEKALDEAKSGYFFAGRFADMARMDRQIERVQRGERPAEAWPMDDPFLAAPVINPLGPFREYPAARAY